MLSNHDTFLVFHQFLELFSYDSFIFLIKFTPICFVFIAIINEIFIFTVLFSNYCFVLLWVFFLE